MCAGNGSWTRMPSIFGIAHSVRSISSSRISPSRVSRRQIVVATDTMPASSAGPPLVAYVDLRGGVIANQHHGQPRLPGGRLLVPLVDFADADHRARIPAAMALPSMSCAGTGALGGSVTSGAETYQSLAWRTTARCVDAAAIRHRIIPRRVRPAIMAPTRDGKPASGHGAAW